jgi:hypothetical protein
MRYRESILSVRPRWANSRPPAFAVPHTSRLHPKALASRPIIGPMVASTATSPAIPRRCSMYHRVFTDMSRRYNPRSPLVADVVPVGVPVRTLEIPKLE